MTISNRFFSQLLAILLHFILLLIPFILYCTSQFSQCEYNDTYSKGISIFFMPGRNKFVETDFTAALFKLRSIGINTLYLSPTYFTPDPTSDAIYDSSGNISESDLFTAITLAKSQGFNVVLKPHVNCSNGQPRYLINPTNYSRWLVSYKNFILHYLSIAQINKLNSFVVATELDSVVEHDSFIAFCDSIRESSQISIIYSSSSNHFVNTKLWQHVDVMGINAYFNLDNSLPPSPNTMHESWNYWLILISQYSSMKRKHVIITEVGYVSRNTAAKNPGDFSGDTIEGLNVQKECYEALLSQADCFDKIKGIVFWQWELGKDDIREKFDYTPRGKPAENVIQKYWGAQEQ
jgi:hypothetical protein